MALEGNASSRGWTFLNELHQTPMCKSGRPDLDEIRGASFVIAKVTIEATKPLGLKQAGWYKTDFPLLNYIAI